MLMFDQEAEEESETMMDSYIQSGDGSIEQFIEEYQERRKLAHMRRIKVEKMTKEPKRMMKIAAPLSCLKSKQSNRN